jgi:DNA-binding MarR family transcriptional regulator
MLVTIDQESRQNREEIAKRVSWLAGVDMSYTAIQILEQMKNDGTTRMKELAQAIGVTPGTVTRRIKISRSAASSFGLRTVKTDEQAS